MQLCSPTTRTLGSPLTNGVWCGEYGKPFELALQKLYGKNRSRVGWKRDRERMRERVIVCPWLWSYVEFTALSPSYLFCSSFPCSSFFISLQHCSVPAYLSFHPSSSFSPIASPSSCAPSLFPCLLSHCLMWPSFTVLPSSSLPFQHCVTILVLSSFCFCTQVLSHIRIHVICIL